MTTLADINAELEKELQPQAATPRKRKTPEEILKGRKLSKRRKTPEEILKGRKLTPRVNTKVMGSELKKAGIPLNDMRNIVDPFDTSGVDPRKNIERAKTAFSVAKGVPILGAIPSAIEGVAKMGVQAIDDVNQTFIKGEPLNPRKFSSREFVGSAMQVGGAAVPLGKATGLLQKGAALAGEGAAFAAGEVLSKDGEFEDAAMAGAIGAAVAPALGALPVVASLTKKGSSRALNALSGIDEATARTINPARFAEKGSEEFLEYVGGQVERSDKLKSYFEQASKARIDHKVDTPLGLAARNVDEVVKGLEIKMKEAGKGVGSVKQKLGTKAVGKAEDVNAIVDSFTKDINKMGVTVDGKGVVKALKGRTSKLSSSEEKVVSEIYSSLKDLSSDPNLLKATDVRDIIGNKISKVKFDQGNATVLEGINAKTRSGLKTLVEKIGGEEITTANARFSELKRLHDEVTKSLGKGGKNAEFLLNRVLSNRGRLSQEVFKKIQEETGVDLVEDAVFARLSTELLGNTKQKSLFQQAVERGDIWTKALGAIRSGAQKISNPKSRALRLSQQNIQ